MQRRVQLWVRQLTIFAGSALSYYLGTVIGTILSVPPSGFAIIWPTTALLISIFLIVPPKRWWLCVAAVVPTHFYVAETLQPHAPLPVVLTQISGNLLLALSTVLAVRVAIGRRILFDTLKSLLTFILVAGIAVPAVVNAAILSVHVSLGWAGDLWLSWQQWMIAGIFPTITIPPVLLLAFNGRLAGQPTASQYPDLELGALIALLFAFSFAAYGGATDAAAWPALFLAPFPFLLWAAARLGVGGTSLALLALACAIVAQALRHSGPFALQSPIADVLSLQAFLITISIPLLLLAALMDERRRTANLLRQSAGRMNVAAASTDTGLWQWDQGQQLLWLTDHCRTMFGLSEGAKLTPYAFIDAVHPQDRDRMEQAIDAAMTGAESQPAEDYRVLCRGQTRWLLLYMNAQLDSLGKVQVSGVFRDVTERVLALTEASDLRQRLARLREDERRRIAEELHDSTVQHLVAAQLGLSAMTAKVRSPSARGLLASVKASLQEASTEIRTFSYLLHPPQLDRAGLSGVLHDYVPGFESRTGIRTSLRISPVANLLPNEQQHALLRVAQESLSNVHRHARANHVSISVRCFSGNVHLVVRDDGQGIEFEHGQDLCERLRLGVGIPGMAARVERLGGRLGVGSGTKGTTIHVAIPFTHASVNRLH